MKKISLQSSYSFLISTLILLAFSHQSYCCNYTTYNDALIPVEHPISMYTIDPLNNEKLISFGFWSLCIPQQTFTNYPPVIQDYIQSMPQDGQLLFLIQGKQQNLVLGYIYMNMVSRQVLYKIVIFGNPNQIIEFRFTPVEFEEEWILSLFTINFESRTFTVEMTNQTKQSRNILNDIKYERIIIGGQGYIDQGFNLNIFKGRLSRIHMSYQINDMQFQYMNENCRIPLPQEGQQTVYFIKGLQIFEGSSSLLYSLNQFGNKFCLSGWVKYDTSRIVTEVKYNLIRMSLFKHYNFEQKYGDEIFQMIPLINKANPRGSYVSVVVDDRLMPIMGDKDYNIISSRVATFYEYSYRYFIGLQQWHFIKYEYGSKVQGRKSNVQIQFFNDLGLKEININNISPINSPFYINIGADDFYKDILLASIFDFKFEYNYEDDKQILFQACHYSCQTCRGPLEFNCITCNPQSNRYYLDEINKCECQQGYINVENESNCVEFSQIFPLIKMQEVLHLDAIQCQFGYFILPTIGISGQCIKCPQSNFQNLLCVDCLYSPYTWYLKPICKFDLISVKDSPNEAFFSVERDQIYYDLYLVNNQGEINIQEGILDFCEMESDSPNCFKAAQKHLNQTIFIKCKPNYFQLNGNCVQVNPYCLKASVEGKCLQYQNGMYLKNDQLYQCPINCEQCQYNEETQNPYCIKCTEFFTLDNGQCIQCGNYCKVCQKYNDPNNQNSYFRCYKCIDDSKYFISFDAINCQKNTIANCIYAFQTLSDNFLINTLDVQFKPRNDWENIKINCALCNLQYGVILDSSLCIRMHEVMCQFSVVQKIVNIAIDDNIFYTILDYDYYTTPQGEQITFGFLDDGTIILTSYQYCIISQKYFKQQDIEVMQFTEQCQGNVKNCEVCLRDRTYLWGITYDCLECEKGYYADRVSGKCYQCPPELNCYKCQSQQKYYKDRWKNSIRAFYKVAIQKNTDHMFRQYGQSDNYDDYEIVCSECQTQYELRNERCILACPESCLECQYINGQNLCVKCPKNQKGRKLSLSQNQCIDCPQNCALCRLRSKYEIQSINPLFDNNNYIPYTYQCLKSFNDAEYYYDQEQGIFIQCQEHQYCNYEFVLTFNLYCSELEYKQELNQISSLYEQNIFKQKNLLLSDLVSGISFKEFEQDIFYHQANEKSIRTIILNISSVKEQTCKIPSNGIIQQVFSQNIFSTINVEITINFNNNTIIEYEKPIKFLNFNKIIILGAIFHPIHNDKLKQIIFDSKYPQTIILKHIVYQQISNESDQSSILFINVKKVVFDNFKIIGLIQNQIENFIEIAQTVNSKTITFMNFQLLNSFLQNQITINCQLNKDDTIYIDNLIVNSKFNNVTLIKTGQQQQCGVLQINNVNFQIDVLDCLFFLNLYSLRQIEIKTITIENSIIQNSTLVILNNNNNIDNFIIQLSKFRQNSYAIINSDQLSLDQLSINLSNIIIQLNEYHQSTKFISFQKYYNNQSQIEINQLKILNNYISQNTHNYIQNTQYSALLYLQLDLITIIDLEIIRGYGLIDISITDVQQLKIISSKISQGHQYKFLGLHQFMDCQLQQVKGEFYLQSLFISSVLDLQIDDLIIRSAQTYNSPILYYKSSEKIKQQQFETIKFSNIIIESNLMLLTSQKFQTAILFFESVQETILQFSNITFYGNILHEYLQNNLQTSALLLNLNCIQGTIIISDSNFIKNIVLNSTDSIIYIKSEKLVFNNCTFSENSIFNYAILQPYLLWGFLESQTVYIQELSQIFRIKSQSGNGKLLVEHLDIQFCIFQQSIGYSGGALLIEAQKDSIINIVNSQFRNISTEFQSEIGFGGSIYLDGTSSQSLNVTFQQLNIINIYAQEQGGFLYIKTGTSQVQIYLNKLNIQNVYAKIGSIIYATFSALEQSLQQIEFNEISIKNTQEEFINYLNQYTQLSKSEEILLINNRVLFLINSASKVRFTNINIENIFLESALSISSITEISIKHLIISNSLINSNLIRISANTYQHQILQLNDIQISNITMIFKQTSYNCKSNQIEENPIQFACIQQLAPINLIHKFKKSSITYGECIFSLINQNKDQIIIDDLNQGLILFLDLTEQTTIKLYQIQLISINCNFCLKGLIYFHFQKIATLLEQQYMTNIMISNSICGRQGCINIEKSNINNRRQLYPQEKFIQQLKLEFLLDNYLCQYNIGTNGTCLYISNVKVEMQNSLFQYNQAYQVGGAVYIKESDDILIINSWILNNQAKIGGGVYLETSHDLDYQRLQTKISNNSAKFFGDNIVSIPQKLTLTQFDEMTYLQTIQIIETDNLIIEQISSQIPFINYIQLPSGQKISNYIKFNKNTRQYLPLNQIFRILAQSRDKQIIKNLGNTFCTIQSRMLNISNNNNDDNVIFSNNFTNIQKIQFNESTQDYNLDDLIVYFNNKLPSNIVLQLQFQCNSIIIPIYNQEYPYNVLNKHSNYNLRVNIKTFDCQYGEIKNYTDFSCIPCNSEQGLFSLTIDSQKCELKDDVSTINVQSALINLKTGYWRPYFETNSISNCINKPENCLGGWIEGDRSCLKGHLGALCEECDLFAIRQEGYYSTSSKYSCVSCQENSRNYILISFVTIWTLISIFISVQSNLRSIKQSIRVTSILLIKLAAIQNRNQSAVLIKMLTNYLQIMASIATFKLKLPIEFQSTINTAGSPVQTMTYSMDCFLSNLFSFEIQYARMIWQIIMPFVYISFFFTCYLLAIKFKFTSYNKSVITTTIIYMYIYLQTSLVGGFAQLISYRNISGHQWIQANVSQRFDTPYHYQWILQFCMPMLILLSIIIPSYFLYGLSSNSKNLDKNYVKSQWGYLYNEYTYQAYFWELIKIAQKQLMMICLIYYDDNVILKATMIALIIGVYLQLSLKYKPYNRNYLNKLDCQTMNVCLATILLASGIYISEQTNVFEVKIPYFVLIAIMNILITYILISKIVVEYFKKAGLNIERIEKIKQSIRKKFPFLNEIPFISKLLQDRREQRKRIAQLYMKLKQFLLPQAKEIIAFKVSQFKQDSQRNLEQQIHTNQLSLRSLNHAKDQEFLFRESMKQSSLNTSKHVLESTVFDKINLKRTEQQKAKYELNQKKLTLTQITSNDKIIKDNKEQQ